MDDKQFFNTFPMRQARIRRPERRIYRNKQRAVQYADELETQFRSLGEHDRKRRWIIVWRLPPDNPYYDPDRPQLLPIPFLAFADETIADEDHILLPIIHEIMMQQASGMGGFR